MLHTGKIKRTNALLAFQMAVTVPLIAACVSLCVLQVYGDGAQAQYGVPDTGYDSSYAAPTGTGYSAPSASYDYGYDQGGYGTAQEEGLDLSKLTDLIPVFVVVFAAIILAQLVAPLFTSLLALVVAVIPGALGFKVPIINALLNPFQLQLCDLATPPNPAMGRSFTSRDMGSIFGGDFDARQLDALTTFVDEAVNAFSSEYHSSEMPSHI